MEYLSRTEPHQCLVGDEQIFNDSQLSDGSLRFICLTTLLLQPNPPEVIIIDEPELGLHPQAINKLSSIIQVASQKSQIIISTQSVNLVDNFTAEDIIVVEGDCEFTMTTLVEKNGIPVGDRAAQSTNTTYISFS